MTTPSSGRPLIVYLDSDSGWGGSSRSLYYMIENLDRTRFEPLVVLNSEGPVLARYEKLGVECLVSPELARFRPSERKNAFSFVLYRWRRRRLGRLVRELAGRIGAGRQALLHVNHDGLASTGNVLARRLRLPWLVHCRVQLIPGWFARRVYRMMIRNAARMVCISEPVRDHVERVAGERIPPEKVRVIHNITPTDARAPEPLPELQVPPDRFRVLSLSNFSPNRGVDRIVEVAAELKRRGETQFAFYLCGRPANRSALTGKVVPYYDRLVERVRELGLEDMVFFPGHVGEPERALAASDALIKLTRQSNPWGRDIMEAMTAGLPVITLGTYQGFVEDGVNGFIDREYDPGRIAGHLIALATDPALTARMAAANTAKANTLFDGEARARDIEAVYRDVLGQS